MKGFISVKEVKKIASEISNGLTKLSGDDEPSMYATIVL